MKKTPATVLLIIFNALAFFAGIYTAFASAVPAVPLGFGVAALMRFYRDKYSLKPSLFMLLAFAPALLIAGGLMAARLVKFPEYHFYLHKFTDQLETVIFTLTVAVVSAIIYAVAALIRRKRKAIDTP